MDPVRTRSITWADPAMLAAAGRALSGIDHLRAVLERGLGRPPIAELMDFSLVEVDPGRTAFEATPAEFHYNPIGSVHGGYAATLLDSAMGCAVATTLGVGVTYTTLELKVNFVRAMTAQTGPVRCEGTVVHRGRRVATAEGRLTSVATGALLAHGSTTCLIVGEPEP